MGKTNIVTKYMHVAIIIIILMLFVQKSTDIAALLSTFLAAATMDSYTMD